MAGFHSRLGRFKYLQDEKKDVKDRVVHEIRFELGMVYNFEEK